MTTATKATLLLATMKRCAEINPNVGRIEDIPAGRLRVIYEPPMWGHRIDKQALKNAVAPELWWTWTLQVGDAQPVVLNGEKDVLAILEGVPLADVQARWGTAEQVFASATQGYLFHVKAER